MNNNINLGTNLGTSKLNNVFNNTNKKTQGILGNIDFNFNNITNTVSSSVNNAVNTYQSYSPLKRILIIIGFLIIIGIISYLIYLRLFISPGEIFLPDLRNDATKPFTLKHQQVPETISDQYTYSFWLYINGHPNDSEYWGSYRQGDWKHVLHRGHKLINNQTNLQSPGFWLAPNTNKLYAAISTNKEVEFITLGDIDMDRWVNIVFVRRGSVIEIYKNCKLEKTLSLYHQPLIASGSSILITQDGGFAGNISHIQYFNQALSPSEVETICLANKKTFNEDMLKRVNSSWSGYETRPIHIEPESEIDPNGDNGQDNSEVCQ